MNTRGQDLSCGPNPACLYFLYGPEMKTNLYTFKWLPKKKKKSKEQYFEIQILKVYKTQILCS